MTRVAWVTPTYPPDRGGVSDHSFGMVSALREQGHDVLVCSTPHEQGFKHLDAELAAYRPEVIFVAYVPLGYAPRTGGIAPAFTWWCLQARRRHAATFVLLAHEVCMGYAELWAVSEYKLALLGAAQAAQFEILGRTFDGITFSHEGLRDIWAKRMPRLSRNMRTVRICSSIPVVASADPTADLIRAGYVVPAQTVLFFGSGHETVSFDFVEAAFRALSEIEPQAHLIIIGMDSAKLRSLQPSLADLGPRVETLGFVPAREVSLWLQAAKLVLCPIVDGVNARKTTVMAALQHGCALATTRGANTRGDIPWDQLCAVAPLEKTAFAETAVRCFQDPAWRASLGKAAQAEYEAHSSTSITAAQLLGNALSLDAVRRS